MRIILLVAVVLVLALIVAGVLAYRRRAGRELRRSATWKPYVHTLNEIRGGRRVVNISCARMDSQGNIYERFVVKTLDGHTQDFEKALFNAKEDAVVNCATLNS